MWSQPHLPRITTLPRFPATVQLWGTVRILVDGPLLLTVPLPFASPIRLPIAIRRPVPVQRRLLKFNGLLMFNGQASKSYPISAHLQGCQAHKAEVLPLPIVDLSSALFRVYPVLILISLISCYLLPMSYVADPLLVPDYFWILPETLTLLPGTDSCMCDTTSDSRFRYSTC